MSNTKTIIGEGTYGCVIKEPLECKKKKDSSFYKNKVSKVMTSKAAKEELEEMKKISETKGIEKYAMNVPDLCVPHLNEEFDNIVSRCRGKSVSRAYKQKKESLRLLILENGGNDLNTIQKKMYKSFTNQEKKLFFTSILNLLDGVDFFIKNNIIHHDIKCGNIVYNINTGIAKFIDFGLATQISKVIQKSKYNNNEFAVSHSYFPQESSCMNKSDFNYSIQYHCEKVRINYNNNFDRFIEEAANSFDMFCLSLALFDLFEPLLFIEEKSKNKDVYHFLSEAIEVLNRYINSNLKTRKKDPKELKKEYKELLEVYKLYDTDKPTPSPEIISLSSKFSFSLDPIINCPPLKPDYNPITKKCLPKCKDGKVRNENFRCVKKNNTQKKRKTTTLSKITKCENKNKDYNPKTRRCVKKCGPRQIRNAEFKCVSKKKPTALPSSLFTLNSDSL